MRQNKVPLYIVGMPKNEFYSELIKAKLLSVLNRLEKSYSKIDEARVTIKRQRIGGKKQNCEVSILIITPRRRHCYKEVGWDLSKVCETLGQRLLRNLTKRHKKRLKKSKIYCGRNS